MNVTYQGQVYRLSSESAIKVFCTLIEKLKRLAA